MLDRYVTGAVNRISPEAPVPVLTVEGERAVAGGAANVALNAADLGAQVEVAGGGLVRYGRAGNCIEKDAGSKSNLR